MNVNTGEIREFTDEEMQREKERIEKEYVMLTKKEAGLLKKQKPQDRVAMLQKMRGKSSKFGRNYFKKDTDV